MENQEAKHRQEEIKHAEAVKLNISQLLETKAATCQGLLSGWDVVTLSIAISLKRIADAMERKGRLST